MAALTGTAITTAHNYAEFVDNFFNQHNLLSVAKNKWRQVDPSGLDRPMPTGNDEISALAFYDGTDTALPATDEANTLFLGPNLDWTFSYAIAYIDHATRAKNSGDSVRVAEKVTRGEIAAKAHMRLLNDNISQGDGTSNVIAGFPAFVKTSGSYAGVTQASGVWAAQTAVAVTGGITNLTYDKIEQALILTLGRLENEPGVDFFTSFAVRRVIMGLAQAQQRFTGSNSLFNIGANNFETEGYPWTFDRSFDTASDNTIYIIPPSVMDWGFDLSDEIKGWHDLTARISTEAMTFLGFGNMMCRRPNSTAKITIA